MANEACKTGIYTSVYIRIYALDGTDYISTIVAKKVSIIIIINTEVMYIRICMHGIKSRFLSTLDGIQVRCARMRVMSIYHTQ